MAKVALIAVHGVGYHSPGASANAMADLLHSLRTPSVSAPGPARTYTAFEADAIHIPLQPVPVTPLPMPDKPFKFLQERSANFAQYLRTSRVASAPGGVGSDFMRLQLSDYTGGADGNTFHTTRLRGKGTDRDTSAETEVHIYEAYWADLARPKNTLLSFFFALFQLLLHLGSLSRLAIDSGARENQGGVWRAFRAAQEYAVRILQIPIPLLNLILLIAAFSVLPQQFSKENAGVLALALAAIVGVLFGFLPWRKISRWVWVPGGPVRWALLPLFFAAVSVAIGYVLLAWLSSPFILAAVEWWLLGLALYLYVLGKYDDVRDGALEIGLTLYGICLAGFLAALSLAPAPPSSSSSAYSTVLTEPALWTMQWILAGLRISWILLFLFGVAAFILGWLAWFRLPKKSPEQRARARAAVRTSRLALALPALLLLLLFIFLWGGLFDWTVHSGLFSTHPLFPMEPGVRPTAAPRFQSLTFLFFDPADIPKVLGNEPASRHDINPNNYFAALLVWSVGPGLAITLALMASAFFLLAWWALPAALTEKFPLRGQEQPPRWSTNKQSLHLGAWLSRGLDGLSLVTLLMWSAIFLVPVAFPIWAHYQRDLPFLKTMNAFSDSILMHGVKLTASVAALGLIVRYGSSALGIVLDVDNYLRTSPKNATPRAKIVERYVSLLRYIAKPEQGYTRVVIVAHSLGALISGDLLRFLREEGDPDLVRLGYGGPGGNPPKIPISLFTMGNPARQFLNRFFPFLYDWVRASPDGGLRPVGAITLDPPPDPIPADKLPKPKYLGVERWVNAYRSGDYIGRSLWLENWYGRNLKGEDKGTAVPGQPVHVVRSAPPPREEMCIGAGAHQHYWDDTAIDIAEQLNALIA